jgi:hypothetical protein
MNVRRYLKRLFGRLLTPSYVSTIIWICTDTIEIVFFGLALSMVLAMASPFLETAAEACHELRTKRQARRKTALLERYIPFINAYKDIVTKYPPGLLPPPLQQSLSAQLDILAHHLQLLKGDKTTRYATAYDLVLALSVHQHDFDLWDLDECQDFVQGLLSELSAAATASWRGFLNRLRQPSLAGEWVGPLARVEHELDNAIHQALSHSLLVSLTANAPEVHARICALLKLDTFHRQAALQTYLSSPRMHCSPHEVADTVAYLRSEAVAAAFLAVLNPARKS